ncbi:hypothetical protein CORC01_04518 [Colletotrichum orchidophilum]|uniref:Uncharacterized protein n=1 Tax=Colletotrichum orchidophilum TaxID=1209926 RepID=A0A1G4BF51_9PEZI|nr:uncharacterized protein CORC01_04518 [Colletotrichum orchidophilum]OHF00110.1 hypothetical protein CORC01_04518 [Colletotrichum orchidophilum]
MCPYHAMGFAFPDCDVSLVSVVLPETTTCTDQSESWPEPEPERKAIIRLPAADPIELRSLRYLRRGTYVPAYYVHLTKVRVDNVRYG